MTAVNENLTDVRRPAVAMIAEIAPTAKPASHAPQLADNSFEYVAVVIPKLVVRGLDAYSPYRPYFVISIHSGFAFMRPMACSSAFGVSIIYQDRLSVRLPSLQRPDSRLQNLFIEDLCDRVLMSTERISCPGALR